MCMYALTVSTMESKNVNEAMTEPAWIESMQEEFLQFKRLDIWVLVPGPNTIKPLTLRWLFKNKHDEENTVIINKTRLVVRGYHQEEEIDFEESFAQVARIHFQEYFRWNSILRRIVGEMVIKETRLYDAINRESRIRVSICLLCPSPLDADQLAYYGFHFNKIPI
nr:Gag-Pol polyprotein [Tanacetum cinerariifolium]